MIQQAINDMDPMSQATIELLDMIATGSRSEQLMRIYALMDLVSALSATELLSYAAHVEVKRADVAA
jgi:hypothetical protein